LRSDFGRMRHWPRSYSWRKRDGGSLPIVHGRYALALTPT
jgi:hypothetical protein